MAQKIGSFGFITNASGGGGGGSYTAGDGITLNVLEFDIDSAQTTITSILNAGLVVGRDSDNFVDFTTDNQIKFKALGAYRVFIDKGGIFPSASDGASLGSTSKEFSDLYLADGGKIVFDNGSAQIISTDNGELTIATSNVSLGVKFASRNFEKSKGNVAGATIGDIVNFGTGNVNAGSVYYYSSGGAWVVADKANATAATGFLAMAMATGSAASVGMCIRGMITAGGNIGAIGDKAYLSATGTINNSASTTSGDFVRLLGYSMNSTNGQMYFNASNDWIEIA